MFFMSHETYSPKRGGSSAAEIKALRETFGDGARKVPIANTKGFTGHTMGVGVEDVVALRCLQKGLLPPIPNLRQPDPEFADLNLSRGGKCDAKYALRLAAGFGSQIVMALYKSISREENRITDLHGHRSWLKAVTGYSDPVISVESRTLKVAERAGVQKVAAASTQVQEQAMPAKTEAKAIAASKTSGGEEIRQKILSLLSEKTGYPPEMLDTDLDLEADLGIDTVKQAEFISEVRETFDIPRIDGLKIAEFPTIEHIINFVREHTEKDSPDLIQSEASAGASADKAAIQEKILSLLSAKTGYPAEMLDTGLDLEADLGIDTVKQAEFISEVRDSFDIPRIDGLKIADFPTIDHIIGFVMEKTRAEASAAAAPVEEKPSENIPSAAEEIRMFETRLVAFGSPQSMPLPDAEEVLVIGGPEDFSKQVADAVAKLGYNSIRLSALPSPLQLKGKRIGVISLHPLESDPTSLTKTFQLFLDCAAAFENGPALFVSVASEDGAFGFENPSENAHLAGAVAGATKSFAREYPDSLVRILDVHPDLDPADAAHAIAESLRQALPVETAVGKSLELRAVRLVPSLEESAGAAVNPGEVILVSGGAKGITAECLRKLAEQNTLTVVILGRTEISNRTEQLARFTPDEWEQEKSKIVERLKRSGSMVTPVMVERELASEKGEAEVYRTISDLRAAGSEVIYRALDIRDADAVDAAIHNVAETCGRVDIVIHAAGIDNSRALKSKTLDQIETVVAVKLQGMRNILASLEKHEMPPRRIIGFGSVSGRFGNLAQLDYSAANDGLSHLQRSEDA
jgi:NAD(P)-dependent dehydrogenase (short-subunit alcohol dehydrogenase family)/acyl carrier protein